MGPLVVLGPGPCVCAALHRNRGTIRENSFQESGNPPGVGTAGAAFIGTASDRPDVSSSAEGIRLAPASSRVDPHPTVAAPMRFVSRRIVQLVVVLLAVTFLTSLTVSLLPGDAAFQVCAGQCDEQQYQAVRARMGLDKPVVVRYVEWLGRVLPPDVDLGESAINNIPVSQSLRERLPVTLELLFFSLFLGLLLSVPVGVYSARRPNGIVDKVSTVLGFLFLAVPPYVLALVLVALFAVKYRFFPATGYTSFGDNPVENLRSLFLPSLTLALGEVAVFSRLLRGDLMATLQEDYVMMARAKGLTPRRVLWRHAFRPSLFSLITVIGLRMGALIGGTLIVEQIFVINGIGLYAIRAILSRDFIPLQGAVVVIAVGYVFINFAVDLIYAVLDPRIRHARSIA